jgi:hypothetical protein
MSTLACYRRDRTLQRYSHRLLLTLASRVDDLVLVYHAHTELEVEWTRVGQEARRNQTVSDEFILSSFSVMLSADQRIL